MQNREVIGKGRMSNGERKEEPYKMSPEWDDSTEVSQKGSVGRYIDRSYLIDKSSVYANMKIRSSEGNEMQTTFFGSKDDLFSGLSGVSSGLFGGEWKAAKEAMIRKVDSEAGLNEALKRKTDAEAGIVTTKGQADANVSNSVAFIIRLMGLVFLGLVVFFCYGVVDGFATVDSLIKLMYTFVGLFVILVVLGLGVSGGWKLIKMIRGLWQ